MERLRKNQLVRATVEGYNSAGLGVARVNGRVVFVPRGARGDSCLLRLVKVPDSGPLYARIEKLETPSPYRRDDDCPVSGRCGGCDFRHISYEEELYLKQTRVGETLRRIGGIDIIPEPIIPAPETVAYRNKALFPVRCVDGSPVTGFYRPRSHDIVPVDVCALQTGAANALSRALRNWMVRYRIPAYDEKSREGTIRHLFVRTGAHTGQALCCVSATKTKLPHTAALVEALRAAYPGLSGVVLDTNTGCDNLALRGDQRLLWGRGRMEEKLGGFVFSLSAMSFFQVNPTQAERLCGLAVEMAAPAENETAVDLYCGAGALTLQLARRAATVVGIDNVHSAIDDAKENARHNGITNIEFICADAGRAAADLVQRGIRPGVLVVDPPRRGLHDSVVKAVGQLAPPRMVYVSCDPATLARDIKYLHEVGMNTVRCAVLDMFPRTANVECVAGLVRA